MMFYNLYNGLPEPIKHMFDVISLATAIGTFVASWGPTISLWLSMVWLGLRIYETWLTIKEKRKSLKEN